MARKSVIIDIDGRTVRLAAAVAGKPSAGASFERLTLPEYIDPAIAADVGGFIGEQLSALHLSGGRAVMLAPRGRAVLMDLALPGEIDEDDLPAMVRYQAEKELPFSPDSAALDFRPNSCPPPSEDPTTCVSAYAMQAATLDYYRGVAQAAGFSRVSLTLRPLALAACARRGVQVEPGECAAVVFIAADEVEVDFIADGQLVFSRSAALPAGKSSDRAERVVREVKLSVQGLTAARADLELGGILLGGDDQVSSVACAQMEGRMDCECRVFRPGMLRAAERLDQQWLAVVGAVLAECGPNAELPDLLNPRRAPDRRAVRNRQIMLAVLTGVMAVVLAGWFGFSGLSDLKKEAKSVGARRKEAETHSKSVQKLSRRVRAIRQWPDDQVNWLEHLAYISQLAPGAETLYIAEMKTDADGGLTLSVRATGADVIQEFAAALAGVEGYSVTLPRLSPSRRDPLDLGYEYETNLSIQIDSEMAVALSDNPPGRPADDDSEHELPNRLGRRNGSRRGR